LDEFFKFLQWNKHVPKRYIRLKLIFILNFLLEKISSILYFAVEGGFTSHLQKLAYAIKHAIVIGEPSKTLRDQRKKGISRE
jgi:hypothetical protein